MSYTKTTWIAGLAPGISAINLNNLETQYDGIQAILTTRGDIFYRNATVLDRLPAGTEGYLLQMGASDPQWYASVLHKKIRKTSDETVNNSNTLQDDDELLLAVGANEVWTIEAILRLSCKTASNFKYAFTIPVAGSFLGYDCAIISDDGKDYWGPVDLETPRNVTTATMVDDWLYIKGMYVGGANAGNIQLQWAQLTAEVEDTLVLTNSYMLAHKLS